MRPNFRVVGVYLVGVFIGALDTNVLGPAFPSLMRAFGVPLGWVAWTITAYTVAYVAATVLAGAVGDRHGRRRMFRLGLGLFGLASVLAATAHSLPVFLVARAIQGAGAGVVYPNAQAEGIGHFPPERRGMALGLFAAVFGLASIVGPVVGGALTEYVGWPSIFLVNVPIVAVALLAARGLPESRPGERALPDWLGGAAFAGMLAAVLLAVEAGGPARLPLFVLAALLLVLFLARQRRVATPFLDTRPLASPAGAAMVVGAALIGLNMSAAVFVPTLAQETLAFTALASGLSLLPAALTGAVLAGVGGVLVDRVGPRAVLQTGLVAGVAGGLLLAWPHLTLGRFLVAMVAFGLATAFTMGAPLNRMALALYREEQAGEALSLVAVFRSVGLAAGPVLLTAAEAVHGFSGMFGAVAAASLVGFLLFWGVPDVRPLPRARAGAGRA